MQLACSARAAPTAPQTGLAEFAVPFLLAFFFSFCPFLTLPCRSRLSKFSGFAFIFPVERVDEQPPTIVAEIPQIWMLRWRTCTVPAQRHAALQTKRSAYKLM